MPALSRVLRAHFEDFEAAKVAAEVGGAAADDDVTRAIVFCNNRELVALMQRELRGEEPLIRARWVGGWMDLDRWMDGCMDGWVVIWMDGMHF